MVEISDDDTVRLCIVSRVLRPRDELIRFVVDPDGNVVPDLKRRLPGRGAWVTSARDLVDLAIRKRHFARSFARPVRADPELPERVDALLVKAALGSLSLTLKAGQIVIGYHKVERAIEAGRVRYLLHAADASPDGCCRLNRRLLSGSAKDNGSARIFRCLDGRQLSLALGRPNVVHAALMEGGASAELAAAVGRLERYRAGSEVFAGGEGLETEDV